MIEETRADLQAVSARFMNGFPPKDRLQSRESIKRKLFERWPDTGGNQSIWEEIAPAMAFYFVGMAREWNIPIQFQFKPGKFQPEPLRPLPNSHRLITPAQASLVLPRISTNCCIFLPL